MPVILLFVYLILLLYISYITSNAILLTPQFGFVASFIPQVFLAIFYIDRWNLKLSFETIAVVVGGIFLFVFSGYVFFYIIRPVRLGQFLHIKKHRDKEINGGSIFSVKSWKLAFIIVLQIVTMLFLVRYLLSLSPGATFHQAVLYYRYTNLFSENSFTIPGIIRMMRTFCVSSGYIWIYLLIQTIIYKEKTNKMLLFFNLVLSILNDIMLGARTGLAMIIVAGVVQYYFINGRKKGWKRAFSFKIIFRIFVISCIFVATFQPIAIMMGRTLATEYSFMDYIAGYLSAPLKNLNVFLEKGQFGSDIQNNQTLNGIIPLLARITHHPEWVHKLDLPFVYENGYNFGNVYTIFYAYIYDMGYVGILVYIPIMSFISQLLYKRAIRSEETSGVSLAVVIYSYVFFAIVFSFFSNKFYEIVANTKFLWTVMSWYALNWFIRLKIRVGNIF